MIHGLPLLLNHSMSEIYEDSQLFSGCALLVILSIQPVLYLMKSSHFEVFYYIHIINYISIMYIAVLHEAELIFLFGVLWLMDIFIRYLYTSTPIEIHLKTSSCEQFVELSYVSILPHQPSQYAFLMLPDISYFESHPFSYVSSSSDHMIKHIIKVQGSWTRLLRDLAKHQSKVYGFVESPYGGLPWPLQRFKVVVLISGGIGCTPNISILKQLAHLHSQGHRFLRIEFLWTLREKDATLIDMVNLAALSTAFHTDAEKAISSGDNESTLNAEIYFTQPRSLNNNDVAPPSSNGISQFSKRLAVCESLNRVSTFAEAMVCV